MSHCLFSFDITCPNPMIQENIADGRIALRLLLFIIPTSIINNGGIACMVSENSSLSVKDRSELIYPTWSDYIS